MITVLFVDGATRTGGGPRFEVVDPATGLGREGSTDGIDEFTATQYIATDW